MDFFQFAVSSIFGVTQIHFSSGTYHLILTYTADGSTHSYEKTYTI